jgi:ParB family chromosome partitioning protein
MIGLLNLPEEVKDMIVDGKISQSHARVLSKMDDKEEVIKLANKIVDDGINVRDLEVVSKTQDIKKNHKINRKDDYDYTYVENMICDKLGTKVKIRNNKINISFNNINDLNRILELLNISE